MKDGIFISYRREDTRHVAARLRSELASRFGEDRVFRDIDAIGPGTNFATALDQALASCSVLLALVGDRWLTTSDAGGRRRIDDPEDWTAREILGALERRIAVIPVLVDGVPPLRPADVPDRLAPLAQLQAHALADTRWKGDVDALAEAIRRHRQAAAASGAKPVPGRQRWAWLAAAALLAIVALAWTVFGSRRGADAEPTKGLPNLSGTWRWVAGNEEYQILQDAQRFEIAVFALDTARQVGKGSGYLEGDRFQMVLDIERAGSKFGNLDCTLKVASGSASMDGTCGLADQAPITLTR